MSQEQSEAENFFMSTDDGIDLDDILPTKVKKEINQNHSDSKKKVKKRPARQKHLTLDQVLNSGEEFDLDDAFQFSSSQMASKESSEPIKKTDAKKESPKIQNKPTEVRNEIKTIPKNHDSNVDITPLEQVEVSLINYISTAVYSIREDFISSLKDMLDNSKNEQSMIDAFMLSLPSEINELVASELENVKDILSSSSDSCIFAINNQLEQLQNIFPFQKLKAHSVSVDDLQDEILNANITMNDKFNSLLVDVQNESEILASLRQQSAIYEENNRIDSPNNILLIEAEADTKRLEIEKQFHEYRKKRLRFMEKCSKDAELLSDRIANSEDNELLNRFTQLSRRIPRSKYQDVIENMKTVSNSAICILNDLHKYRKKLKSEIKILLVQQQKKESKIKKVQKKPKVPTHGKSNVLQETNKIKPTQTEQLKQKPSKPPKVKQEQKSNENNEISEKSSGSSISMISEPKSINNGESIIIGEIREQLKQMREQNAQKDDEISE